ncbi:tyrosine-type recombinase/integrase [Phyllobacterium phragmitis]|uniref:Tyrosine-type recombinase/integrase n=1 Tax=Phyllobacterium phragmitis TaxID=2670329 RepID=A0ABQ0GYH6_9HYPH
MSVYKSSKSPFYQYDFQINGRRFLGSTKAKSRKDAEAVERQLKAKARDDIEQEKQTGNGPLTLDTAAGRYWSEVGQHHANSATTWTDLERLLGRLGKDTRLDAITDADVAALVAWRRAQTIKGRKKDKNGNPVQLIAPATVNRSTTILLKSIFTRAKRTWRYTFPMEPNWRDHMLKEPQERIRELDDFEAHALEDAFAGKHERTNKHQRKSHRTDYALWFEFARLTGLRRNETLIRWKNVNIFAKRITTVGKGGKQVSTPITPEVQHILDQCKGHHPDYVFTYVCQRPREGQIKGQRYPITPENAKTMWRRVKARAGVENFRFHDIRHDTATKLLRATGNLKLVQRALNHSDIKTTVKYAHVLDDEVADALSNVAKSRKISRTNLAKSG